MDIHQAVNLGIYNEFHTRKIGFAYPTQTLYLHKDKSLDEVKTDIVPVT
jgi:hypothetical protein